MMRNLSSLVTGAAFLLTAGLTGCISVEDPLDSFTTATSLADQGDADMGDTETGDGDGDTDPGDGDGDTTGDGDGDTTGDGDGDGGCGDFDCPCVDSSTCNDGLECVDGTCQFPPMDTGDGDGDTDTMGGDEPYNPEMCMPPGMPIGVEGIEGGFCSYECMGDVDCPAGPPGTQPACALQTPDMVTYCALICTPGMDACPSGSSCKEVPMQPGVGLCTYP